MGLGEGVGPTCLSMASRIRLWENKGGWRGRERGGEGCACSVANPRCRGRNESERRRMEKGDDEGRMSGKDGCSIGSGCR